MRQIPAAWPDLDARTAILRIQKTQRLFVLVGLSLVPLVYILALQMPTIRTEIGQRLGRARASVRVAGEPIRILRQKGGSCRIILPLELDIPEMGAGWERAWCDQMVFGNLKFVPDSSSPSLPWLGDPEVPRGGMIPRRFEAVFPVDLFPSSGPAPRGTFTCSLSLLGLRSPTWGNVNLLNVPCSFRVDLSKAQ